MSIALTCSCGAKLQAKQEHAGKRLQCPKCGEALSIPEQAAAAPQKLSAARQHIEISGTNNDAVAAIREFIGQLQKADFESNPFCDRRYEFKIFVDRVSAGNAFVRYLLVSFLGRPTVTLSFSLANNGQAITQNTFTASAFFQNSRDAGFRGGAFGGSNVSFIRTNCRKLAIQIAADVATKLNLADKDRKLLLAALNGKAGDASTLKWMGITAGVLAVSFSAIGLSAAPANDKFPAIFGGLFAGALLGCLIGLVLARVAGLFAKIMGR